MSPVSFLLVLLSLLFYTSPQHPHTHPEALVLVRLRKGEEERSEGLEVYFKETGAVQPSKPCLFCPHTAKIPLLRGSISR